MIKKVTLANGIELLTEDIPYVHSMAVGVWVNVGSRDESEDVAGISHFIEHMMFKGTGKRTAKEIAEALDAVGGQLNAFTTKEYTCYYAKVLDEHMELAFDILSDMLFNSNYATEDINRERNVIIEEIKMYEDTPDELVHDIFSSTIWKNNSLGRPIIGFSQVIEDLNRDALIKFMKKFYQAKNIVISVAGNINHDLVAEKINNFFGKVKGEPYKRILAQPVPEMEVVCRSKDTEQVHLCIGSSGLPLDHQQVYAFQLVNTVLGGGLSSRLFQEIREQRGLVYSIYSYHSSYYDTGLFCIYAGLSKKNVEPALELIFKELKAIRNQGISKEELRRAKDQLKGNLLLSLESVSTRMSRLGKSQLYLGKILTPEDIVEKIEQVKVDDIFDLVAARFDPANFSIASVGPWDDYLSMEKIIGRG